jgi:hypothetical protein
MPMLFFLPESNDLVDPGYDFETDRYSVDVARLRPDVYAHEIFDHPPFDGLLISKSIITEDTECRIMEAKGVHAYLRISSDYPILGDCGAFQFIADEIPPYTNEEIYEYYNQLGFDYGITLDHIVVDFDLAYDEGNALFPREPTEDMRNRWQVTIDNAQAMLHLVQERGASFEPIASAQGWSPISYHDAVKALVDMGYTYIALGGLARASDSVIKAVLEATRPTVQQAGVRLHVLGVARSSLADAFEENRVASCDSATTLMQAFKSNTANYHMPDGNHYTCIRIPPVGEGSSLAISPKVSKILKPIDRAWKASMKAVAEDPHDPEKQANCARKKAELEAKKKSLLKLEQEALSSVRAYARGNNSLERVMAALIDYEEQFENNPRMQTLYRRTLKDRPWEQCPCTICKQLGVEVAIMRGNNRNRRRGFHNTYVFYQEFMERRVRRQ